MTEQLQITEYSATTAALAELRTRYASPFDVATSKGMALAKEARAVVRGYRVALDKLRVELKAPALERTRLIDAEAKRITAELLNIEEPIDRQIKAEEQRKEEEKAAKAKAEAERVATIQARINAIRNRANAVANKSAAEIRAALEQTHALDIAPLDFAEFLPDAIKALDETLDTLKNLLIERVAFEEEQARLQAEREAEAARLQAEREELEQLRAEEKARRDAEAAQRAEQARIAAEARRIEEARLRAEREEIDRQRAELAEQQRQIEEAERQRQAAPAPAPAPEVKTTAKRGKVKAPVDPLADLKRAVAAGEITAPVALDQAYAMGFNAGLQSAQQAA